MRISLSIATAFLLFTGTGYQMFAQAPPKPRDTTITGPQTFAMVMGISNYKYIKPLSYADKDAEMFRDYLKSPAGGLLPEDNIYCLLNEQAISTTFWSKGFKWLEAKKLRKGDRLFIYLAGHGDAIDEEQFFYIAYDCNPAGDKNNYLAGGVIQLYNLKLKIQRETGKGVEVYFIMDACRSGELPGGKEGRDFLTSAISEKKAGEIMMLATAAGQQSFEHASIGNGHGLFTYYLVDGLTGSADGENDADNKVTVAEIKKYIDKNVPVIAKTQFKASQDPYFCCSENTEKVVSIVDTAYLNRWLQLKKQQARGGTSFNGMIAGRRMVFTAADTLLLETYNLFNRAVKESRLTGKESADYYYSLLEKKFPGNSYTTDAQSTLAVEFINFAQAKINLYLDCKDPAAIQKIRAQVEEDESTDEMISSLDRMEKVARQEFYEVGNMLEKAVNIIMQDDPDFAKTLIGRMYFFKARGYFNKAKKLVDINNAFQYAYSAYASDKNAAYILNTLSSLHMDNNRIDSAVFYAKKAIVAAPKWRYPYITLAFCYRTLNRPDSAIKYYRKSIETDPDNADAYVDLGHYFYSLSKTDSAALYYTKALQLEPGNVYASNNLGWLNHGKKDYEKAIGFFKRSISYDPKFISAYNGLSKTFFALNQFDSARIYFSNAFANYPDKSIVNVYIGNFYRDLKQYDSAKVYYRMATVIDPAYEDAFNYLGRTSFELKQYDSANIYYKKAFQVNPYSAYPLLNMGIVFKELKENDSTYTYFQKAIQLEPGNPGILNSLGVIYGQDKRYDSARIYFRKALNVRPDYKPATKNLLKIFREMNLGDSISSMLRSSFFQDPGSTSFMNDMGNAFLELKRFDSARFYFRKGLQQDPINPQLLNRMGLTLQGMKMNDSAKVYIQRAIRLEPENPSYWSSIAGVFRQLKQADSAAFYYKKQFLRKTDNNENPVVLQTVGSFYSDMKEYDSAIVYYRRALALDNNYLPALNNAGIAFMELEQYDSAFSYFKHAVRLDPAYQNASLNLGLLYHTMRQYDSAIVYIQNAIKLDVTKPKNYYSLACSYALNNQPEQAIAYLRQAYERGYKNTENLTLDPDLSGLKNYKEFQELMKKYAPDKKEKQ